MANNSQMFARLLPIDIKFFNGESPSPQKMNGIFNYIHAAFYILESYMGNGIDYRMPTNVAAGRKMIFNLSQLLGNTGKLYKPVNKLVSGEYIHRNFGIINKNRGLIDTLHTAHTEYDEALELLTIKDDINIPICLEARTPAGAIEAYNIGLYYTGEGSITISGGNLAESQQLTLPLKTFQTFFWFQPTMDYVDYITLSPGPDDGYGVREPLVISSIYLNKSTETNATSERIYPRNPDGTNNTSTWKEMLHDYNTGYAIPLDNKAFGQELPTFWTIRVPCAYALDNACSRQTCGYCIGNIYDIDVNQSIAKIGAPICGGLTTTSPFIDAIHRPVDIKEDSDTIGQPIEYTPADFSSNPQSQIYTIQSPLLMKQKPYMMKYRPFQAHNLGSGTALTKNESIIYDLSSRTNPVRYNVPIYSAGRPDIVFVFDTNKELVAGGSTTIQVLGGPYTMTEQTEDIIKANTIENSPMVSVYAD